MTGIKGRTHGCVDHDREAGSEIGLDSRGRSHALEVWAQKQSEWGKTLGMRSE